MRGDDSFTQSPQSYRYYEFQEWLDEVLPPGDTWDHFDGDIDQEGDDQGAYNLQLDLGNGVNMMNYTEEWFATSKRPRRIRPSKVCVWTDFERQ